MTITELSTVAPEEFYGAFNEPTRAESFAASLVVPAGDVRILNLRRRISLPSRRSFDFIKAINLSHLQPA